MKRLTLLLLLLVALPGGTALSGCDAAGGSSCCRVCTTGRACGDSCISAGYSCNQPPGCACNG